MTTELKLHPLYPVLMSAIEQCMHGKGERHGGAATPFMDQPMFHYIKMHGRGFATGQAAKKLEEAASTRTGHAFEAEVLGAIVYAASAILAERQKDEAEKAQAMSAPAPREPSYEWLRDAPPKPRRSASIDDCTPEEWNAAALAASGRSFGGND